MIFQGTRGNTSAEILIVGECWTEGDVRNNAAFSGTNKKEMDKLLQESGIDPDSCLYTCAINARPANGFIQNFFYDREAVKQSHVPDFRGLYPGREMLQGLKKLDELIAHVKPKVIVAMGSYAVWAVAQEGYKVSSEQLKYGGAKRSYQVPKNMVAWRGSHLMSVHGIPVVPVFSPNTFNKNYPWRYLTVHDLRLRVPKAMSPATWNEPERDYIIKPSFDQVMQTLQKLILRASLASSPMMIAADIETLGGFIECIGIAWSRTQALVIPIMSRDNVKGYWSAPEEIAIVGLLKQLFEHPNVEVCGQNFIYDYQYLWWFYNIKCNYKQETMLAHHVCYPGTNMGLGYLSSLYSSYHYYWKDDGKEASDKQDDVQRWIYNGRDCVMTFEIMENLWTVLEYHNQWQQYAIQMVRSLAALKMMVRGVRIDQKKQGEEQLKLMEASMAIETRLEDMMPDSVRPPKKSAKESPWYRSPTKLATLFYDILGIAEIRDRKTGALTTNDDALKKIAAREPALGPLCKTLQDYRSLEAFDQFVNMRVGSDKRMRALFSPTTETFRYRASADVFGFGRNLQNIPKGNEDE